MSLSLLEVFESAGYDFTNSYEDCLWLLSKQDEFQELIDKADTTLESAEEV